MNPANRSCLRNAAFAVAGMSWIASPSCAHRPAFAELNTRSREEALQRCETALRSRFATIKTIDRNNGCLSTDDRYISGTTSRRVRAYVVITPGQFGWAAEITVLAEDLDFDSATLLNPSARWVLVGRNAEMEAFLVETLENWTAQTQPVFPGAAEGLPAESASQPARR